ncbi:hypothetical protein Tco_0341545 [Tanacetum coccineum]
MKPLNMKLPSIVGFKAWILFLVSALGTPWDFLDQNLAAIVDLEEMVKVVIIFSGQDSSGNQNSSDGGNTGDGKSEDVGGIISSLESSKELKEVLPDEVEEKVVAPLNSRNVSGTAGH